MMLAHKLAAPMDTPLYVDDVFSTYLYTGNGSTQTITNGIDLAGKGGVVWLKTRSQVGPNQLIDTVRGLGKYLITDTTAAQASASLTYLITAFNSSGFSLGLNNSGENASGVVNASYTFRKAAKFFDVVTWTGDGAGSKLVNHALGGTIGWSLIKRTDSSGDWAVYALNASGNHAYWISAGAGLSTSSAATNSNASFLSSYFTSTTIDVGSISGSGTMALNMSGATYVAYLFAHDPDTTNGIIQCGSYTGNGSTTGPTINLGWEPQFLLIKNAGGIGSWQMVDTMRGMTVDGSDAVLNSDTSAAEFSGTYVAPNATGFQLLTSASGFNTSGSTYIYMAIRRPNKPPTSGTEVLAIDASTNSTSFDLISKQDVFLSAIRSTANGYTPVGFEVGDRLRGYKSTTTNILNTSSTSAEASSSTYQFGTAGDTWSATGFPRINYRLKRAPGFMDMVCYKGAGTVMAVNHNLGVPPELMIIRARDSANNWMVYPNDPQKYLVLNANYSATASSVMWNATQPTSSVFTVGGNDVVSSFSVFVAYLFASLPGISKVGTYTGNGTNQTINCGFTTGARFVLIKRTDSTGDWYIWDTARGIATTTDPHLSLNSTAAEVTTDDSVDPDTTGFIVNQLAATNINVSAGTYLYLAIA